MADDWAEFRTAPAADEWAAFRQAPAAGSDGAPMPPLRGGDGRAGAAPTFAPPLPAGSGDGVLAKTSRAFDPLLQGLTFKFGDEMVAGLHGLTGMVEGKPFTEGYDHAMEVQKQDAQRQQAEYPLLSTAGELAGGALTGAGLMKSGATIVGRGAIGGAANFFRRMLGGAAEGGLYAAASGAGGAEGGLAERFESASKNIPVGMGLGAAAVPITSVATSVARSGRDILASLFGDPVKHADDLLVRRMAQDRTSPEQIAARVEDAAAAGQPAYRALDAAGKNTQQLGGLASRTPGEFRDVAAETMATRQSGQGPRISNAYHDAVGANGPSAYATEEAILAARAREAEPLYDVAYATTPSYDDFYRRMLARPSVQDAVGAAQRTAAENQRPITDLFTDVPNPNASTRKVAEGFMGPNGAAPATRTEVVDPTIEVPTMRGWDKIKKDLDAQVDRLYGSRDTTQATAVAETRDNLRGRLAADNPDYATALGHYSDRSSELGALEAGRNMMQPNVEPAAARAMMANVDPGRRDLVRLGSARGVGAKIVNTDDGVDKTRMFNTPAMREKVEVNAVSPESAQTFSDFLGREREMVRGHRALIGGSPTQERLSDAADVRGQGGALASLVQGQWGRALAQGMGAGFNTVARLSSGMSEPVASRVGSYLLSADPVEIRALQDLFRQASAAQNAPTGIPSVLAAGVNAPRNASERSR